MEYTVKPMQGRRERLEVVIYTQTHKIVGTVHAMPASRLVDCMNSRMAGPFIVVTDASVYMLSDEKLIQSADFFAINKKAITMVFPTTPGAQITSDQIGKETKH